MDEIDRANELAEQSLQHALHAHRKRAARDKRNPADEPGVCADCDEPIEPARLRALPMASRCVACQERKEKAR